MISIPPFQVLEMPCDEAMGWVNNQLADLGLRAVVTFDLQVARVAHPDCPCPHHGTNECDCQLNVMLVYKTGSKPVTILAHGNDGKTWLSLVRTPQQPVDPRFEAIIRKALMPLPLPVDPTEQPHVA